MTTTHSRRLQLAVAIINAACWPFNHLIERQTRHLNGETMPGHMRGDARKRNQTQPPAAGTTLDARLTEQMARAMARNDYEGQAFDADAEVRAYWTGMAEAALAAQREYFAAATAETLDSLGGRP